jgi:hypothetical protein
MWNDLVQQLWGPAVMGTEMEDASDFFELASGLHEANDLWEILQEDSHAPRLASRLSMTNFPVSKLSTAAGLVAASSRQSTEVRLFGRNLTRLPPLRTRGKFVDDLALDANGERLAVGTIDGQVSLYSLEDPEEAPTRLFRAACTESYMQTRSSSSSFGSFFSGFHFLPSGKLLVAAHGKGSGAALIDVDSSGTLAAESKPWICPDRESKLISAVPLKSGGNDIVLLLHATGQTLIWDVRAPDPIHVLDIDIGQGAELQASVVDSHKWNLAAASPGLLHWCDIRAQRAAAVDLLPKYPIEEASTFLTLGARGGLLAVWQGPQQCEGRMLAYGSGTSMPVLAHEGLCNRTPLAVCRPESPSDSSNGAQLIMSLAQPGRNGWDFELCAVGKQGWPAPLQTSSQPPKRSEKPVKANIPQMRRLPVKHGAHGVGRKRTSR